MNARRGRWQRRQTPFFLALIALLWLLMQQQVFTHALAHVISHADGGPQLAAQHKKLPGDSNCERCLNLSPLGASLGSRYAPQFGFAATHESALATALPDPQRPLLRHFDSQAPPAETATL